MKRIILIIFGMLCGYFSPLIAVDTNASRYQDSILKVVDALPPGLERLAYLKNIAYKHQYEPYNMTFAARLYQEGQRLNNVHYQNLGAYYLAICYDKKHDPDSLSYWVDILEDFAPQVDTYDYYLEEKAAVSRALASKRQVEKAIYIAKETLKEAIKYKSNNGKIAAYNSLGCAYSVSSRSNEALDIFLKAYKNFTPQTNVGLKVDILSRITQVYGNAGYDSLKLPYLKEMESTLQTVISKEPNCRKNWTNFEVDCEIKYILHFMNRKDFTAAQEHIEKAKKLLGSHVDPVFWLNVQLVQLQYYAKTCEYDKSIALVNEVIPTVLQNHETVFATLINYKASTQYDKGDLDGAIETLHYLIDKQDSLNSAFSTSQLEQVKDIYHIDELLQEKQKIQDTNYSRGCMILIILILLMLIFYLYTRILSRKISIAEKMTVEAASQAEEENRTKDRLKSEISHDIRTPLNAVVGFAELLTESKELDQDTKKEYGQIIQSNAENLLEYINSILELSRLESGKIQYERTECDIMQLCRQVITAINGKEGSKVSVILQTEIEDLQIQTDKRWFESLLTSLLTPVEDDKEHYQPIVCVNYDHVKSIIYFDVLNAPLAKARFENKTSLIRHEINAHFVHSSGGIYKVQAEAVEGPTISFTIPL